MDEKLKAEILALSAKHKARALPRTWKSKNEKRQNRKTGCGKKRGYTYAYAQRVVYRFAHFHDALVSAYRCRFCQSWHVGHRGDAL